jgi:hypothetical protein
MQGFAGQPYDGQSGYVHQVSSSDAAQQSCSGAWLQPGGACGAPGCGAAGHNWGGELHVFGSRLAPLAGAVLGHGEGGWVGAAMGALGAHGASSAFRSAAEALQASRLQKATDTIARGMPPPVGWRPPPLQIEPAPTVGSMVPWRVVPQLAAPQVQESGVQ